MRQRNVGEIDRIGVLPRLHAVSSRRDLQSEIGKRVKKMFVKKFLATEENYLFVFFRDGSIFKPGHGDVSDPYLKKPCLSRFSCSFHDKILGPVYQDNKLVCGQEIYLLRRHSGRVSWGHVNRGGITKESKDSQLHSRSEFYLRKIKNISPAIFEGAVACEFRRLQRW